MAQVINTNVAALFAGAALNKSNNALQTAQQRLSSGLRINSAKDDITGMGLAVGHEKKFRAADAAMRSANDGISLAQINDGYHAQILDNLQRQREVAVQLGGTAVGAEFTALVAENTRILALAANSVAVVIDETGATGATAGTKGTITAGGTIANIDASIASMLTARGTYGGDMATLSSAVAALETVSVNTKAAYSRVMDTDYASETASAAKNQILQQAGMAALAQANQNPSNVLTLLR